MLSGAGWSSRAEEARFLWPSKNPETTDVEMRALVGVLAWLASKAGADVRQIGRGWHRPAFVGVATHLAQLGPSIRPDRAGRLVPVPEEALEPEHSFAAHWALIAAVALVVLIVGWGYLRRRWRTRGRSVALRRPPFGRSSGRKG